MTEKNQTKSADSENSGKLQVGAIGEGHSTLYQKVVLPVAQGHRTETAEDNKAPKPAEQATEGSAAAVDEPASPGKTAQIAASVAKKRRSSQKPRK